MKNGKIELRYHPALKEMHFRRWTSVGWADIDLSRSNHLHKYVLSKEKNGIILQNLGSEFFDDIKKSMDGYNEIIIDFQGTQLDYGDFKNMIDYNNKKNNNITFSIGGFTELNDMESLYQDIVLFSKETIIALENTSKDNDVLTDTKKELIERIEEIKDKKKKLDNNTINLCFVGAYSTGKSTLINAILGYEILPEALESVTAKMFKIISVDNFVNSDISFEIISNNSFWKVNIEWNDKEKSFFIRSDIQGSNIRKLIQECINNYCTQPMHIQLKQILTIVNKQSNSPNHDDSGNLLDYINGIIEIKYPIPLCINDINFTIYDTPGTDSNNIDHLSILTKALEEQTNSILIFINNPKKLEGTGNSMLMHLLKNIEKNASKSTIDVERSLFVINASDEIMKGIEGFNDVKKGEIKLLQNNTKEKDKNGDDNNYISIPLSDKRLFFISARAAYVARATKNKIATKADENDKRKLEYSLLVDENAGYFKYNNMALSKYNTEKLIKDAEKKVNEIKNTTNNIDDLFVLNSGLYSLENEIKNYGKKFAMAVKAKSIIDAIQYVVDTFDKKIKALDKAKKQEKEELEKTIKELRENLINKINEAKEIFDEKINLDLKNELTSKLIYKLELGENDRKRFINEIDKIYKDIWWLGLTDKFILERNEDVLNRINNCFKEKFNQFNKKSNDLIEEEKNDYDQNIKTLIDNCNIDDEAKETLKNIPDIDVGDDIKIEELVHIEDHLARHWYTLFLLKLDVKKYKENIEREAMTIFDSARLEYITDFKKRLCNKIEEITELFLKNIDRYSGELEILNNNKELVEKQLERLSTLIDDIKKKKEKLNDKIWSKKYVQSL